MLSQKQRILSSFYRTQYPPGILEFEEVLTNAAETSLQKDRISAEAFAQGVSQDRFWNWLLGKLEEDKGRGLCPLFVVKDALARRLSWYPHDHSAIADKGALLVARPSILKKIDSFTDRHFEGLGCTISRYLGAKQVRLLEGRNDEGVDFFAVIPHCRSVHLFREVYGCLRIVGQSKKYATPVETKVITAFAQTLNEVKERNPRVDRLIPPWFHSSDGPIVGMVISHSGFQSGAHEKAHNHGMFLADSVDLAEIAALARMTRVGNAANRSNMLEEMVNEELKRP